MENKSTEPRRKGLVAVAADGNAVSAHFGHCEGFRLATVESGAVVAWGFVPNPGHRPGFLPVFLHERGVTAILAGGMGQGAVDLFLEKGIEVVTGAAGSAEAAVAAYLAGTLQGGSVCREHAHGREHTHGG